MRTKRKLVGLGIVVSTALAAAGVSAQDDWFKPGQHTGRTLNVVVNASMMQPPTAAYMTKLKETFEEASGATVVYHPIPENDLYKKVRLAVIAKTGAYDGMFTGAGGAKDFGLSGQIVEVPKAPDIADFFPGDVDQYTIDGKLYGAPLSSDTNILYWRKDLFEKAGLDPNKQPATYQEMQDYAVRLTEDANGKHPGEEGFDPNNISVYGLAFKGAKKLASTWEWYNYLFAFGGNVFDANFDVTVNSPEAVASLAWVTANFRDKKVYPSDTLTFDYPEFNALFLQGRVAMAINWPFMYALAEDPAQSKVVGLVNVGRKPMAKAHAGNIGGWSFNVLIDAPNQDVALDFAKWVQRAETSEWVADAGITPVRKSVLEANVAKKGEPWQAIAANLPDGQMVLPLATGDSWLPIEEVLQIAIQESLLGQKTPQAALDDAAGKIKEVLDRNGFYTNVLKRN